jgi:sulfoxide reductase heme-binding subunit YedZ
LHPAIRPALHLICALPLSWLVYAAVANQLGANPAEALIRALGDWGLRGLLITLAITPLRVMLGQPLLIRYRRLFGLWAFAYLALHLLAYAWFDQGLDLAEILRDIAKRPFILVGSLALLLLLPLAASSTQAAMRRLGGRRWQLLHRLIYPAAMLGCLHFWWMRSGKQLFTEPLIYTAILALLLGWRLWKRRR